MRKVLREFFFFGISGVFGFLVDTLVLYMLRGYFGPYAARGFSFFAAVIVTWLFNRRITFKENSSGMKLQSEFVSYLALMLAGGAVNYGLYSWLISSYQLVNENPIIGVAAGSIAGMLVNLMTSRLVLFRKKLEH
ncbi:GtrA family protein [Cedecea neteri]|uniref:GtrA family protein n=1 Tax=Cedecea neteri TaxID=158822 RepID=UPI00289CE4A4|nr:GtrA family protein [Cedecea neteri]